MHMQQMYVVFFEPPVAQYERKRVERRQQVNQELLDFTRRIVKRQRRYPETVILQQIIFIGRYLVFPAFFKVGVVQNADVDIVYILQNTF